MGLKTTSESKIQVVTFLEDLNVQWISLVPKGANWTPWKIISKSNETEVQVPGQIIESIILPNSQEWKELAAMPEYAWLNDIEIAKTVKFETVTKYVQAEPEAFEKTSFGGEPLGDTGGLVVFGELKPEYKEKIAKVVAWEPKKAEVEKAPVISAVVPDGMGPTVGSIISNELYRFEDILWASLNQSEAMPQKRKQIIMNALTGFWDFLDSFLDTIGNQTVAKVAHQRTETNKGEDHPPNPTGGVEMTVDEIKALVIDTIKAEKEKEPKVDPAQAVPPASELVGNLTKSVTDLSRIVTDMQAEINTKLNALSEKVAKVEEGNGDTEPGLNVQEQLEALKVDVEGYKERLEKLAHSINASAPADDPEPKQKNASVWSGFFG